VPAFAGIVERVRGVRQFGATFGIDGNAISWR
jgi:hypothetical protein